MDLNFWIRKPSFPVNRFKLCRFTENKTLLNPSDNPRVPLIGMCLSGNDPKELVNSLKDLRSRIKDDSRRSISKKPKNCVRRAESVQVRFEKSKESKVITRADSANNLDKIKKVCFSNLKTDLVDELKLSSTKLKSVYDRKIPSYQKNVVVGQSSGSSTEDSGTNNSDSS